MRSVGNPERFNSLAIESRLPRFYEKGSLGEGDTCEDVLIDTRGRFAIFRTSDGFDGILFPRFLWSTGSIPHAQAVSRIPRREGKGQPMQPVVFVK